MQARDLLSVSTSSLRRSAMTHLEGSWKLPLSSVPIWSGGSMRPSPVPAAAGVYGWHFKQPLHPVLDAGRLLYVGIAPRYIAKRTSTQNLRKRVRYHYRGNAAGSTLRLTLGCLLGLELRRVGSGKRMTFGRAGETTLSQWMAVQRAGVLDRAKRAVGP
ncbi:GIY-YIG nuclease family protein [Streptomyces sp. NPDC046831]|uniref:GIY-YIG nuclease family protein n=1 Tax=Streptomyces sp. NPDC046831 TaxID=3154805 RepID=UPI0033E19A37